MYLHSEPDPRYRGPAIPSKAFKFLQSMTDGYPDMATYSTTGRIPLTRSYITLIKQNALHR